jgi:hypothetical protein
MKTLFVVFHEHDTDVQPDTSKLIGIYSSQERATDAVARYQQKPGFSEHPFGFSIDEYLVDEDHWKEGYITEQ